MKNLLKTALTLSLFYSLTFSLSYAQNPDLKRTWHWYFGVGAGIDFTTGVSIIDLSGTHMIEEPIAVISDTSGSLLFYTDGDSVWDKNHDMMQNGTGIGGCLSSAFA